MTVNPFYRYGADRISLVTPFTYRDGVSLLKLIEDLRNFINNGLIAEINDNYSTISGSIDAVVTSLNDKVNEVEQDYANNVLTTEQAFTTLYDTFTGDVNSLVNSINNRNAGIPLQRVYLDADKTFTIDPLWPDEHVISVSVEQDSQGGWTLTLPSNVSGQPIISGEPGSTSFFDLIPDGVGGYEVRTPDDVTVAGLTMPATNAMVSGLLKDTRKVRVTHNIVEHESPKYRYHIFEVFTGGFVPGVVEKHFTDNYEKTYTSGNFLPPMTDIFTHAQQGGGSIVVNGSAWSDSGGFMTGLTIKDGVGYQDFATTPKGRHAIGVDREGRFHILRQGRDSLASALAMGITDTWTYGPPLVENGVKENLTSLASEWADVTAQRPRTVIGQRENGNVAVICVEGDNSYSNGASHVHLADLAVEIGLYNALVLDGGGSTQALVSGSEVVRSQDSTRRVIPESLQIVVPASITTPKTGYETIATTVDGTLNVKLTGGTDRRLIIRGNITGVTVINTIVATLTNRKFIPNDWIYTTVPIVIGGIIQIATVAIKSNGEIQITRRQSGDWLATDRYDFNIDEVLD